MNLVGDYFAIGLVVVLGLFFFDGKHSLNKASRFFVASLILTACTSALDIISVTLIDRAGVPLWVNMLMNSLYFEVNILTTSFFALYLFSKILEHSHARHCMRNAQTGLAACLGVYTAFVVINLWTGWLFHFDSMMNYIRGPLNAIGYFVTLIQMVLVLICYIRNRKNAGSAMRRVLIQIFPVVAMCIIIQRLYPEIMLNSLIMSMVCAVLFLTFSAQRPGIHAFTRLNDRHQFFDDMKSRLKSGSGFQVFLIDIKNFSMINQKYGHLFGDELLYQFAFALEKLIKGSEAFHMNGTVFALALPYSNQHAAEKNLSTLLEFLESGISCDGDYISLDYVAVECMADEAYSNPSEFYELLEFAASKAYRSKNRYIRCTRELYDEMLRRRYLIERLQNVDHAHGFRTWYQPIRSMSTGSFSSMEALVRIVDEDGNIISPAEFIPLAEQTGMIAPITWFVIEDVCRLLRDNPRLETVSVGINLPMAQMLDKGFLVRLNGIVDSYRIARKRICLEFTEREVLANFEQLKSVMQQATVDGYRFFLDDFGSGYSNFNCLLQLPFQIIKLDAALIQMDLGTKLGLTGTLAGFLHSMELEVVAEGVENAEMAEALRSEGVDRIQGFVYARPMPEDALTEFYKIHST